MSADRLARIQLVSLRIHRLSAEAQSCSDIDRLRSISAECEVLRDSLYAIREEQIIEALERSQPGRGFFAGLRQGWKAVMSPRTQAD